MNHYFSHDLHARNTPKLRKLRRELGMEAYGAFWMLVELLHENEGYLQLSALEEIAWAEHCEESLLKSIIMDYQLFKTDGQKFWSESANRRISMRQEAINKKIEAGRLGGKKKQENKLAMLANSASDANEIASDAIAMLDKKLAIKLSHTKPKHISKNGLGQGLEKTKKFERNYPHEFDTIEHSMENAKYLIRQMSRDIPGRPMTSGEFARLMTLPNINYLPEVLEEIDSKPKKFTKAVSFANVIEGCLKQYKPTAAQKNQQRQAGAGAVV